MATYAYVARDASGTRQEGKLAAADIQAAKSRQCPLNVRYYPNSGHSDAAGHRYVIRMLFVHSSLFLCAGAM